MLSRAWFFAYFGSRTARRPERQAHRQTHTELQNRRAPPAVFFAASTDHEGAHRHDEDQPTPAPRAGMRSSERTSQTDDQRIEDVTPLPPPEHLIRFFPIAGTPVETLIAETRARDPPASCSGKDDRLLVVIGPVLDPRPGRRARLRAPPEGRARALRRHARDRDARLLREAAHHGRLEGPDQRSRTSTTASASTRACASRASCCSRSTSSACRPAASSST